MKAILATALVFVAQAGSAAAPVLPDTNFIYVVGNAEIDLPPDRCTLSLTVSAVGSTSGRAAEQLKASSAAVVAQVQRLGLGTDVIDGHELVKSVPYSDKPEQKPEFKRHFTIKVRDLKVATSLADKLVSMDGVKDLQLKFDVVDTSTASKLLTDKAAANAKEKASRLAESFGRKLGRVTAISEESVAQMQSRFGLVDATGIPVEFDVAVKSDRSSYEVPKVLSYSRQLYVVFSLE